MCYDLSMKDSVAHPKLVTNLMRSPIDFEEILELDELESLTTDDLHGDYVVTLYNEKENILLENFSIEVHWFSGAGNPSEYLLSKCPLGIYPFLGALIEAGNWRLVGKRSRWNHTYIIK